MKRKARKRFIETCGECMNVRPHKDKSFDTGKPFWGYCPFKNLSVLFSDERCEDNFKPIKTDVLTRTSNVSG